MQIGNYTTFYKFKQVFQDKDILVVEPRSLDPFIIILESSDCKDEITQWYYEDQVQAKQVRQEILTNYESVLDGVINKLESNAYSLKKYQAMYLHRQPKQERTFSEKKQKPKKPKAKCPDGEKY